MRQTAPSSCRRRMPPSRRGTVFDVDTFQGVRIALIEGAVDVRGAASSKRCCGFPGATGMVQSRRQEWNAGSHARPAFRRTMGERDEDLR
jgi:hypothetical protein